MPAQQSPPQTQEYWPLWLHPQQFVPFMCVDGAAAHLR